jgi:hypothetical protein
MKKILLTIGLMAATSAAFAQGYINFSPGTYLVSTNGSTLSSLIVAAIPKNAVIYPGQTVGVTTIQSGGLYYYEILMQHFTGTVPTDRNIWDGTWKDTGLNGTNHLTVAGRIAPGPTALNVGALVGWNAMAIGGNTFPNGTNYIMLVGWSANLGTSWLGVSNTLASTIQNNANYFNNISGLSFLGESAIGWENPATTAGTGIALMGNSANAGGLPIVQTGGMTLYELPIPEPATFALVGLGGLSLLLFRRRN